MSDEESYDEQYDEEETQIKEALQKLPFEQLLKIKKRMSGKKGDRSSGAPGLAGKSKQINKDAGVAKRRNKNAPLERSSRVPMPKKKPESVLQKKPQGRDPRFDKLSGKFNKDLFEKSYSFLTEKKAAEIKEIGETLKSKKKMKGYTQEEKSTLKGIQGQLKEEIKQFEKAKTMQSVKGEYKKINRDRKAKGLKPFFPKQKDIKEKVLEKEYAALEASGNLEKVMAKKRKQIGRVKLNKFKSIERKAHRRNREQGDYE